MQASSDSSACVKISHKALVYEYMLNGSLDKGIFCGMSGAASSSFLDWSKWWKIILDVAKGLAYLHEDFQKKINDLDSKT
ncbi:hypothetical protein C2S51_029759 [Perilla frutescens var. frutescens]|nr:hypothetical protein C2S51_029759 [Perilla frutescens var. frutescens]